MARASDQLPLAGVRVLDFSRFIAGPYATMLLADAGAEVVKVEPLGGEETRRLDPTIETPSGTASGYFHRFNRTKKSICVDLRSVEGRDVVSRLVPAFDVVVENFRPRVLEDAGLGYEALSTLSPSLVYCSISGYGATPSPRRDDPAFAILAEASAGVLGTTGQPDDAPVRLPQPIGDLVPASQAVSGICMALFRRERTGLGAHVDIAMYDSLVSLNENAIMMSATTGTEMRPSVRLSYTAPFGIFRTSDGFVTIAVVGEKMWLRFCEAIDRPELAVDGRFASGSLRAAAMGGELGELIEKWTAARTRDEAVRRLLACGVPAGVVALPFDVIDAPETAARSLLWEVPSYTGAVARVVGSPIRVEPGGFAPIGPIPAAGEHTHEVLTTLGGYTETEIESLASAGVLGLS